MQEQTPIRKKRKKKPVKKVRAAGNNPYQQVQPKTNGLPGFNFPGAVM